MKKNSDKIRFGNILKKVTEDKKIRPQLEFARVRQAWERVLGNKLGKYVSSSFYKNRTLHITITSAPLKQELSMSRKLLIQRINEECGEDLVDYIEIK